MWAAKPPGHSSCSSRPRGLPGPLGSPRPRAGPVRGPVPAPGVKGGARGVLYRREPPLAVSGKVATGCRLPLGQRLGGCYHVCVSRRQFRLTDSRGAALVRRWSARRRPSQNDVYDLPDAYLCISENNGCDTGYDVGEFCLNSTLTNFSQYAYAIHDDQYIINATSTDDTVSPCKTRLGRSHCRPRSHCRCWRSRALSLGTPDLCTGRVAVRGSPRGRRSCPGLWARSRRGGRRPCSEVSTDHAGGARVGRAAEDFIQTL